MPLIRKTKPGDTIFVYGPMEIRQYRSGSGGIEQVFIPMGTKKVKHVKRTHPPKRARHKKPPIV